jgi:uncharacterized short protein YbdD (DUF466 family)
MVEVLQRCGRALAEIWEGVSGLHAYDQYVAHLRTHHPEREPISREEFYRRELTARWEGIRRCC